MTTHHYTKELFQCVKDGGKPTVADYLADAPEHFFRLTVKHSPLNGDFYAKSYTAVLMRRNGSPILAVLSPDENGVETEYTISLRETLSINEIFDTAEKLINDIYSQKVSVLLKKMGYYKTR